MGKQLYKGYSFFQFIWYLFLRLACVGGLIYTVPHYEENPVVIIVLSLICLLILFIIGDDQITVYEDKVTQTTSSLAALIFKTEAKSVEIKQIKVAHLQKASKLDLTEFGVAMLLAFILPRRKPNNKSQPIFFDLKSGDTVRFDTDIEESKMKKIVDIVNTLAK